MEMSGHSSEVTLRPQTDAWSWRKVQEDMKNALRDWDNMSLDDRAKWTSKWMEMIITLDADLPTAAGLKSFAEVFQD